MALEVIGPRLQRGYPHDTPEIGHSNPGSNWISLTIGLDLINNRCAHIQLFY